MGKNLTEKDLDKYQKGLIANDLQFAARLDSLQAKHFPKRLKNISEWSEAEKIKRLILGMNTEKNEITVGRATLILEE